MSSCYIKKCRSISWECIATLINESSSVFGYMSKLGTFVKSDVSLLLMKFRQRLTTEINRTVSKV